MRPLGCGWSGAMSSLFLELEAEAAKLRPLPQTCTSPGHPKMPGLGMLWWFQPGSASGWSGGAVTFPFPGKPGTWASLPDCQGRATLLGRDAQQGRTRCLSLGLPWAREPCPPGREEPCCPYCSTEQPLRDWRECRTF